MRKHQERFLWLGISILGALTLSPALLGQSYSDSKASSPLTTDWSQHHIIFSKPATAEQVRRVERDPRYWQQQNRQSPLSLQDAETGRALGPEVQPQRMPAASRELPENSKDWTQDLGGGATVGATNYPAKFTFRGTTATCAGGATQPDFVVYTTGVLGSATQATIVAYDNLYSGCSGDGPVPTVYWAYNTGGTVTTSPLISQDGTQIAFVQAGDGYPSTLVLLKWAESGSESVGSPMTLTRVPRDLYHTCVAPCMTTLPLRHSASTYSKDTNSSVFYDYANDTAYVGDDDGWLHQYTPFFKGEPTPIFTGGWPVQVNPGSPTALNSPVFDYGSGNIFVTDNGGFLYLIDSAAAVTQSGQLDFSAANDLGPGIVQGPIVDSTLGFVYVFAASDGSAGCAVGATAYDCTAVYQLTTGFLAGDTGSEAVVGDSTVSGTTPSPLYIGAFDSTYENSDNATGDLYVCGNTGGNPILYQVAIGGGVLGTVNPGPVLSSTTTPCSPVTDVLNPNATGGATEWMFASAETSGVSANCASGGCIFNFKDTPWLPSTLYTVGQEILDSNFHTEFVGTAGTSGSSAPFWNIAQGGSTTDHSVKWLDLGPVSAFPPAAWVKSHSYSKGQEILDTNNNLELVTTAGTSGSTTAPSWNLTVGATTHDGTGALVWTNVGPPATAALAADGGTSGIIIDNIVGSGMLAGASQVYFSTLSGGCGGTGDTDGCAVQASQAALQ
jgi:hypothetical protein